LKKQKKSSSDFDLQMCTIGAKKNTRVCKLTKQLKKK